MREEDSYVDIGNRFIRAIKGLRPEWEVAFSLNKFLPSMVEELETSLNGTTDYHGSYIPNLKLDILLGIKKGNLNHISLVLLEVKVDTITLNHQAQLMGYLIAAPRIHCGILFCVIRPETSRRNSYISSDFNELLTLKSLPMCFSFKSDDPFVDSDFKMGIAYYQYQSMIQWRKNQVSNSINGFSNLIEVIESI